MFPRSLTAMSAEPMNVSTNVQQPPPGRMTALMNAVCAILPSTHELRQSSVGEDRKREGHTLLTSLSPRLSSSDEVTVAGDEKLNEMLFFGECCRTAAEQVIQAQQAVAFVSPREGAPFTRKQSYLLGGLLLVGSVLGSTGYPVIRNRGHRSKRETVALSSVNVLAMQHNEQQVIGQPALLFPHAVASRVKRSEAFPPFLEQTLDALYLQQALPVADKPAVIDAMKQCYRRVSQREPVTAQADQLMQLDMIALGLGEQAGIHQLSYRLLGQGIRQRLESYRHLRAIAQYLNETPPHFSTRRATHASEALLNAYFTLAEQQNVSIHHFFSADSSYLDRLILEVCERKFRGLSDYIPIPALNQSHRIIFDYSSIHGALKLIPKHFTTKEIFLGLHQRYAMTTGLKAFFFPDSTDLFLRQAVEREPNITDFIDEALKKLFEQFKSNQEFKALYEATLDFRALGIVIHALAKDRALEGNKTLGFYLKGWLNPQRVTLWNNTVPNLLALSMPLEPDIIYISLALSEVKLFARNNYGNDIKEFINAHLSIFDRQRLDASHLRPRIICTSRAFQSILGHPDCYDPPLRLEYDDHYPRGLYQALLRQIEQNIDSMTYTNEESERDHLLLFALGSLNALGFLTGILSLSVTGPVGAALLATVGISVGIGEILVNRQLAATTDDGTVYVQALQDARLGIWFAAFGAVADIALGGRALIKQFKAYQRMHHLPHRRLVKGGMQVSLGVKRRLTPDMFETDVVAETLSKPDRRGLQRSTEGVRYLKINDKYIKVSKYAATDTYTLGRGELKVTFNNKRRWVLYKGRKKAQRRTVYKDSPEFRVVKRSIDPSIGAVGYRTLGDNHYVHFYTVADSGPQVGGKTLLVSAHGGFYFSDLATPSVVLPENLTIKLLAPHNTFLEDPSLAKVINRAKNFNAFLTIRNGHHQTHFLPQWHDEWRYATHYDPNLPRNAMGKTDGLPNYRHFHFQHETPTQISDVLIENRVKAATDHVTPSDILVVHDRLALVSDTDPNKASIQRVIDLDREGALVNVNGERYDTIIFSHCRANFLRPEWLGSTYKAVYPAPYGLRSSFRSARVIRSTLHRVSADAPFIRQDDDMGDIAFYPVRHRVRRRNRTPTTARAKGGPSPVTR